MDKCEPHNFLACRLAVWTWRTVTLLIVVVGTVGNILSVVVLRQPGMRKYPTSVYLLSLALADTGVLWTSSFAYSIQDGYGVNLRTSSQLWCKSLFFVSFATGSCSVWLLLLLTVDRVLLTRFPILARRLLTRQHAVIATAITCVGCFLVNSHYMVGFAVQTVRVSIINNGTNDTAYEYQTLCTHLPEFDTFYTEVWAEFVLFVVGGIPLVIIIAGNMTILVTLFFQRRRMRKIDPGAPGGRNDAKANNRKSRTKILFLITAVFLVTTLPNNSAKVVIKYIENPSPRVQANIVFVRCLFLNVIFCNFTFNFVLYILSGSMFKQEWSALLKRWKIRCGTMFGQSSGNANTSSTTNNSTRQTNTQSDLI